MRDLINDLQKSGTWKVQLTIAINFIYPKDVEEECILYLKSDNTESMTYDKAYEVLDELFKPLLSRYQISLETLMEGSDFIFDLVQLLYYKCHRINFKRGGSYRISRLDKKLESTYKSY